MATIWIPALLRPLTDGQATVSASGASVSALIDDLETRFPGLRARLVEGNQLRPDLTVVIDGEAGRLRLRQPVQAGSEVHFVVTLSGG